MTDGQPKPVKILQAKARLADPHDCTDEKDVLTILNAVYDTLIRREGSAFRPCLATIWTVSDDALHWRFDLRPGAVFHDGTPCDAPAVVRSLQRMARPDKGYTLGALGVWHQYLGGAEMRADAAGTVSITLKEPVADLLDILSQGYIAAPAMIEALDQGDMPLPCGSGPYRVEAVEPGAVHAVRVAGEGPARLTWKAEPDVALRLQSLSAGKTEVATGLSVGTGQDDPGITSVAHENPVAIIYLLNAARGPLSDRRLRAALNFAIDRDAILEAARGGAGRPLSAIMPSISLGASRTPPLQQDLPAARRLLAGAGYAEGLTLTLDCPTRLPDEAEALTAALGRHLAALGIQLDVRFHPDREAYAHMVRRKEIGDLCVFDSSPLSTFRVLYEKIDSR
ncbi:MAG: ABC transporter substrate-binding protein, partial [Pseudomonadota bacterium]